MNEKILVVDDERELADLLEVYLKNDDYTVYKYYNGRDALKWIEENTPDLAILDVMLPDNLLRNAVLYSYPDTEVAITAEVRGSKAVICFRNHGDAIPEEKLARIFEQFYRLDAARSSSGGAGLGLAIARQIVELHGGVIEARSAEDMIEFTVKLPLSQENCKNLHGEKEETRAEEQINKTPVFDTMKVHKSRRFYFYRQKSEGRTVWNGKEYRH